ncbi:MAG: Ig-like domain-containing protein [Thermoflexales bacterium]|nr:Ig-like domain-containing protein [Thermoflexales bacterium]
MFSPRLSKIVLVVIVLSIAALACNVPSPTPTATPTPAATATPVPLNLPPVLLERTPERGEEQGTDAPITLVFNQAMEPTSVEAAFKLAPPVQGKFQWEDDKTLNFVPAGEGFAHDESYQVTLDTSARGKNGLALNNPVSFRFNAVGFLQVSQVLPAPDTLDVNPDSSITVMFNRPVVPLTTLAGQEGLPQPLELEPAAAGRGEWLNTSIYVFHPEALVPGATYTARIRTGLADTAGATLEEDYIWTFSVMPPQVVFTDPPDRQDFVGLRVPISVTFNQAMDTTSAEAAFGLYVGQEAAGNSLPGKFQWNAETNTLGFRPARPLALGTRYTAALLAGAKAANGQAGTRSDYTWTFDTVPALRLLRTEPADGDQNADVYGPIQLIFSAPANVDTIMPNLRIAPEPKARDVYTYFNYYDRSFVVSFPRQPSTDYVVTLGAGVADPYGNRLGSQTVVRFRTRALDAMAYFNTPGQMGTYNAYTATSLYAVYRNVQTMDLGLYRMPLDDFGRLAGQDGWDFWDTYRPSELNLVRRWTAEAAPDVALNEMAYLKTYLAPTEDGAPFPNGGSSLPPGIYYLEITSPQVRQRDYMGTSRHVLIVGSANVVLKAAEREALAWVTDLNTGQPMPNMPLTLYDENFRIFASGQTAEDGTFSTQWDEPRDAWETMYAVVGEPFVELYESRGSGAFGVAANQWSDGISPWDFGIDTRFYNEPYQVYFQTDKPIYRPGQTVYFKAIVRSDDDARYRLPDEGGGLYLSATDSEGKEVFTDTVSLNAFGTFNGQLTLDAEAPLGYYNISVWLPDPFSKAMGKASGVASTRQLASMPYGRQYSVSFFVAEYRRPEFQVSVTADKAAYVQGDKINVAVQAEYFFGGALSGAQVEWQVLSSRRWFDYQGQGWYDWTDDDAYGERYYGGQEVIASGSGQTDAQGRLLIPLQADLGKRNYSQDWTVDVSVTDVNDQVVSGRTSVPVHQGQFYIGLAPERYVGSAGERQNVNVLSVDWDSRAYGQANLSVTFYQREWFSVKEESDYGPVWTTSYSDTAVFAQSVTTNEAGQAQAYFTPEQGGTYRIVATGLDSAGNEVRSATYLWVSSRAYVSWRQENNDRIELVADKRSYRPGETARILIPSPFQGQVKALVTVERGRILGHQVITLQSNSETLDLPITADMAPNAYVSVVLVKGVDETTPVAAFKLGYASFEVSPEQQEIQLTVSSDRSRYSPNDEVVYTIRATDYAGQPVQAELALALVDLSVLSLADSNSPPIVQSFYGQRGLGVRTGSGLVLSVDRLNVKLATEIKGGGGGAMEAARDIRGDFRDTAYWNAVVATDQAGQATVSAKLPDNLTTWRLTAKGVTAETLVGETTHDVVSTKDLLVRPVTPRFFVVGDKVTLAAVVHNNTPSPLDVEVRLDAQGVQLEGQPAQVASIKAGDKVRVEWPVVVQDTNAANLVFSARGGGLSDASKPTAGLPPDQRLPVYKYSTPEVVATAGTLAEAGERLEVIALSPRMAGDSELTVQLEPSLAAGMTEGLTWLENYPYQCTEQTVSRFLPNAMSYRALKKLGLADPQLETRLKEQVSVGLQRLYAQVHVDGGWGWWVNSDSNATTTAWVVFGLAKVREAGFAVDEAVLANGASFLQGQLVAPSQLKTAPQANMQAWMLYVLAEAGQADAGRMVALYDGKRDLLSSYGKAYLALALHLAQPEETSRLNALLSDLNNAAIASATGMHWEEDERDWWAWNTDTRSTAIILDALARLDKDNALAPNVVRWLMTARTAGRWETTQETAWALIALTDWMEASGELKANYVWRLLLNNTVLGDGQITPDKVRDTITVRKAVAELLREQGNALVIGRSGGEGRLYYSAHLRTYVPVEEVRAVNRGLAITRQYIRADDPCLADSKKTCTPVTSARVGDVLQVRLTIVAPNDLYYAVIEDPLPAGTEAVDTSLKTTSQAAEEPGLEAGAGERNWYEWGWWWFSHTELRDEKVALFASYLPRGTYQYTYQVRASVAGEFRVLPATGQEFYFPEVFGRSDGAIMTID